MPNGGVAGRLGDAIKRKGWSVYRLSQEVEGSGLSYSSLRNYVNGVTTPRAEVLQTLADLLGVSVGSLTGETEREDAPASGLYFALGQRGRIQMKGPPEEMQAFRVIVNGLNRFPDIPTAAKDIVLRFLLDVHFRGGAFGSVSEVEEAVRRFFPTLRAGGSYGESMAAILSSAAVAYLSEFGSGRAAPALEEE